MPAEPVDHDGAGTIGGIDHVAFPMLDGPATVAFYRSLGLEVTESDLLVQVHLGAQTVNFHRPEFWRRDVELRARAATPPCGDLCLEWRGSEAALQSLLDGAGAHVVEGPTERRGGRRMTGSSVYVRDPDGNLVEFIRYPGQDGRPVVDGE